MPESNDTLVAAASGHPATLDRRDAFPRLVGDQRDFLFVGGLAGSAKDVGVLTDDGDNAFILSGAMGAAAMIGFGLALAQPDRRVLVAAGDGEMLMNIGSLATIAVTNPANLAIICVDNGHYGETGYQQSHTSLGVDLEKIAQGAGIRRTCTIWSEDQIAQGASMIRQGNGTAFVVLKVKPTQPPAYRRNLDAAAGRLRFRGALR